jgi:hypothetical protein
MVEFNTIAPYIYAAVSLIIILLVWIAYASWRIKRMLYNEINQPSISNETQNYPNQQYQGYQNYR